MPCTLRLAMLAMKPKKTVYSYVCPGNLSRTITLNIEKMEIKAGDGKTYKDPYYLGSHSMKPYDLEDVASMSFDNLSFPALDNCFGEMYMRVVGKFDGEAWCIYFKRVD